MTYKQGAVNKPVHAGCWLFAFNTAVQAWDSLVMRLRDQPTLELWECEAGKSKPQTTCCYVGREDLFPLFWGNKELHSVMVNDTKAGTVRVDSIRLIQRIHKK